MKTAPKVAKKITIKCRCSAGRGILRRDIALRNQKCRNRIFGGRRQSEATTALWMSDKSHLVVSVKRLAFSDGDKLTLVEIQSAVAASLCRRTPKRAS